MFALGVVYWLYGRPLDATIEHINAKFAAKKPAVAQANILTLKAGYHFGETAEFFDQQYQVPKAKLPKGAAIGKITGNEATALGMIAAAQLASKQLVYCSYPITPASDILHALAAQKNFNVITFQAEDEIAAMGAAIGASFGGALGCTGTSGPGSVAAQERGDWFGGHDRTPRRDHRRAARRPQYRPSNQDRAERSASSHVRP